jgi:DNA polymerase III epsilon subunit family exonuclease
MHKLVIIDFETTGFSGTKDQIIEIGALKVSLDNPQHYETYTTLVKANALLPQKIIEITHITDGMLKEKGIDQVEAAQALYQFIDEDAIILGYNVMFDIGFLVPFFKKYVSQNYVFNHSVLDVLTVFRDRHPYPHKLENAVAFYQVRNQSSHRALDDVIATYEVFLKMLQEKEGTYETYINTIGYNHKYGYRGQSFPQLKMFPQRNGMKDIEIAKKFR